MSTARAWTPAQLAGIQTVGRSLLVSAAAGSGKTAMLSERCAYLVCDAAEPYRCDVDELLVVTFTDAAAAEMRERIGRAIRNRVASSPGGADERLARQVHLIDQAQVSTLHSFCSRLLRQHFHLVGLDPAFAVMDGEEAKLLRLEVGRELMQDRYELDDDGAFQRLVDAYAEGDDERLLRHVLRTHELLTSLVDPDAWVERSRARIVEAAEAPLMQSALGGELVDLLGVRLAALRGRCAAALDLVTSLGGFSGYAELLGGLLQALRHWEKILADPAWGPDALAAEMAALVLPALPRVGNDVPNKAVAKAAVEQVVKEIKSGGLRDVLRFTADQWRDGMRLVAPHAHTFLTVVDQFRVRYRRAKDAARQLDFADLERYALEVLRDGRRDGLRPTPTARSYHRLFKHVLVDEYQDINEVQDAILSLLSHECVSDRPGTVPNLFSVGDVKQSIYRFRLAEPERFLQREQSFRTGRDGHGEVIDLQANFRSRGPLLEAINGVFERLMTREAAEIQYDQTHRLTAGKTYPDAGGVPSFPGAPIELHVLPAKFGTGGGEGDDDAAGPSDGPEDFELDRAEREAVLVARRIRELMGDGEGPRLHVLDRDDRTYRPIRYKDVVILLRSMRYKADGYAEVLRQAGVPVHAESGTGYFESVEVRDMLALLAVLDNQRQDVPLAALLRSPLVGLPQAEDALARVRLAYAAREQPVPFHQAVVRYATEQEDDLAGRLREFLKQLHAWRQTAHRRPLAETIAGIYEQTGYLAYVAGLAGGDQRVANLMHLHERAAQFGTFQRQGLSRFLEFLEQLRAESDLGQPSVATEAEDVVRIMSIHRSKGLEFPVVILPDLGKSINLSDCQGSVTMDREAGLGMAVVDDRRQARYPSLSSTLVRERLRRQAMAEEMRVLYVAMTRAKEHLVLVGTAAESAAEKWHARWSDHRGPLPADTVLGARCLLEWLGPVAACAAGVAGEIVRTTAYGSAEVAAWELPSRRREEPQEWRGKVARLEKLDPPPPPHPAAEAVIRRLEFVYPYERYAKVAAAQAASAGEAAPGGGGGRGAEADGRKSHIPDLRFATPAPPLPRFVARDPVRAAADAGTATHLVLEHLDYTRPLDAADLDAQIADLVDRRLLAAEQAAAVDRDAVGWFVSSDVGRLVRGNASRLLRELPVYLAVAPDGDDEANPSADPADRVMVRGRIDLLVPGPDGATVIDYKTDSVTAEALAARAAHYRPQVEQYRAAVEQIMGEPVARVCLVFLSPRVVWELPRGNGSIV